jgi:circadian clock protein KaiC
MAKHSRRRGERVPTGITGLDTILRGGLFRGGIYIVRGHPGSGKTILGNQICFAHARAGGKATMVTLLAESHARMMLHLESMEFFDPDLAAQKIEYLSGFNVLESQGLRGVLDLLRRELKTKKSTLLIVDGLVAIRETAPSVTDLKKFIHELQLHADLAGCTVLLLTGPAEGGVQPENTMVDGIFELKDERHELRAFRQLHVHKFRGDGALRGGHFFKITNQGVKVYPRIEALYVQPAPQEPSEIVKVTTGIQSLDDMLHGGVSRGTTTMVMGPSGSGKTTVGLHFLAGAPKTEKEIFFGFYETPERLMMKSRALNLDLERRVKKGTLQVFWNPSTERNVDELVGELLAAVDRMGATRLVIDGLDGLQRATLHPDRVHHVFTALANQLRLKGVTTLYTFESPRFIGMEVESPVGGISTLVENLLFLRFVELRSTLHRLLSIVKVRDGDYDSSLREFRITENGIHLEHTFEGAEQILSGMARENDGYPRVTSGALGARLSGER